MDEWPMPNGYGIETFPQESGQPGRAWLAAAKAISNNTVSLINCFCVSFNLIVAICAYVLSTISIQFIGNRGI